MGGALTVKGAAGDNLALHRALAEACPGEVIVADVGEGQNAGHWGELMTIAAQARGVVGVIINGSIRDRSALVSRRFPVYFHGTSPLQATKQEPGTIRIPLKLRGVFIEPGDQIAADDDGIVVIPKRSAREILASAAALEDREAAIARCLEQGETTIDVLGL